MFVPSEACLGRTSYYTSSDMCVKLLDGLPLEVDEPGVMPGYVIGVEHKSV